MAARAPLRSAQSSPAPRRPAAAPAGRARSLSYVEEGRPFWMECMQIPLTGLGDGILGRLEQLGPGYEGWGREEDRGEPYGLFFVDVDGTRYRGRSLHQAISAALIRRS